MSVIVIVIIIVVVAENLFSSGFNKHEYDKSMGKFVCTQILCFESR